MSITQTDRDSLLASWQRLTDTFQVRAAVSAKLFEAMARKYDHPTRHYHNLRHISEMLAFIEARQEQISNNAAVAFAVWFHDLEYNTLKDDNEEKSAAHARKALDKMKIPAAIIDTVQEMILATKTHQVNSPTEDMKIFLDADLAILAAPRERYKEYSKQIRQEYYWVPSFMYGRKRIAVLEAFQERDPLYYSAGMVAEQTSTARENIAWEIDSLS